MRTRTCLCAHPPARTDKQAIIVKAEGEAQAAKLIGDEVRRDKSFIELRRIEAAREIAHVISKSTNKVYLDSSALLLNYKPDVEKNQ